MGAGAPRGPDRRKLPRGRPGLTIRTIDFFAVLGKEATITGSYAWGDVDFESAAELIRDGALDVSGWITTMPLADGQRAFQELVGGAGRFKVVLTF